MEVIKQTERENSVERYLAAVLTSSAGDEDRRLGRHDGFASGLGRAMWAQGSTLSEHDGKKVTTVDI